MKGLRKHEDAYGRAMLDHFEGRGEDAIIERDDGMITADVAMATYFSDFTDWAPWEREGAGLVRGRVLDVGAGAGRASLHLQSAGHDVVAIDNSPLAAEVCRRRGVKDVRVVPFTQVSAKLGTFDSLVMYGNNFGLFGTFERARWMLRRLKKLTSSKARIVAQSLDPYATDIPEHLSYHRRNRKRGRLAGQLRIRVRYLKLATPWFDYLIASPDEIEKIVAGTGWHVEGSIEAGLEGIRPFVAVIDRDD